MTNQFEMDQFQTLIMDILQNGRYKSNRTGVGTYSVFGRQCRFDLSDGKLPVVTTKKVALKAVIHEVMWLLSGNTNIQYLKDHKVKIWDEWANDDGELGPLYGEQWRFWPKIVKKERPITLEERVRISDCQEARDLYFKIRQSYERKGSRYGRWVQDLNALLDDIDTPRMREERLVEGHIDQVAEAIEMLKTRPDSRRILISAWNPNDLPDETVSPQDNVEADRMALAPCHAFFQFYTDLLTIEERQAIARRRGFHIGLDPAIGEDYNEDAIHALLDAPGIPRRRLSCQLYMRSNDIFLGWPFNTMGYCLLTHMVAQVVNMEPGEFVWSGGDVHLYENHLDVAKEVLNREPLTPPTVKLNPKITDIDDFAFDDINVVNYESHGKLTGTVAV